MAISLVQPAEGSVSWGATVDQDFASIQDFINNRRLPTKCVQGLTCNYVSGSQVTVGPGSCRDSADALDMLLASSANVTLSSNGVNGLDVKTAAGTVTMSSSSNTVTGTSTAFLTDFGTRNLAAGTIGTGGVASTTITGSGTSFLSQVSVNDLLGNSSVGFSRVTAIASDTSLTVSQSLTIANGSTGTVIENPTIQLTTGGTETFQVDKVSSNTSLLTVVAAGVTHSSGSMTIGAAPSVASGFFLYVWLVAGTSGTQPIASTQRTTLLNPGAGYSTSARRIGSLCYQTGAVAPFFQRGLGQRRDSLLFPLASSSDTGTLLSNGSVSASYTAVAANPCAPPTASVVKLQIELFQPTGASFTQLSVTSRESSGSIFNNLFMEALKSGVAIGAADVPCDGAQYVSYVLSQASGSSANLFLFGYSEDL